MKFAAKMSVPLKIRPSEYMRGQVWVTFLDDAVGAANAGEYGARRYIWGSDYPHTDSTWPESRSVIERNFGDVSEDIVRQITSENVAELYRIEL